MATSTTTPVDYRALIQDRKSKQTRATIRHVLCLAPDLFAELELLQAESRAEQLTGSQDSAPADVRLSDVPVPTQIAELEAKIEAASVVGVFKAPTAERQAELNKAFEGDDVDVVSHTISVILDAFTHFEVNREPLSSEDLGRSDLADLLPVMAQGELLQLGNKIIEASAGAPDLPFSVQRSLLNRRSAGTSKRR